ncbi:MAG: FtsX-like permease family protein [Xanthomonadales bacterium]|nr:ABC transporter permease [Gammaproteobacteria bacterium]NNK03325.1 FtsX-like permease family protein [Xanthomonadales bacterium]
MELGPIWRALLRNKTGAILIALQIAVTMAIMVNAISIMQERSSMMARPSGIDEQNTFILSSDGFAADFNERVTVEEDLAALRAMPGVVNAIQSNSIPLSGGGWSMGLQTEPGAEIDGTGVAVYFVDQHGLETFGLNLVAGENFSATDIAWRGRSETSWPDKTIITRAMAAALYPDDPGSALGKTVYINDDEPLVITGIIEQMQAPWNGWDGVERVMLTPNYTLFGGADYIIRTEPGRRDELMPQVEALLAERNRDRIVRSMRSMEEIRERSYRGDSSMIKILAFTIILLIAVTSLGIVGLASFSVNRRTKQIGTRRALGASKVAVLRYFMTENFIISLIGVVIGAALTIGLNIVMIEAFSLSRITWYLVPAAMLMLLVVGQLAVLGPAKRAASVPPAVATRTV